MLGVVKVGADFEDEYPDGDTTCTEAYASLVRTGDALLGELDRRIRLTFGVPQPAATALAVIDGASAPLTPSQVSERVLIPSATMTAMLDLLERRGWIHRIPNPDDRRSVLIEITPDGRATADQMLPGIRALERSVLSALTPDERACLLNLLGKILTRTADVAAEHPEPLNGQRIRPSGALLGEEADQRLVELPGVTDVLRAVHQGAPVRAGRDRRGGRLCRRRDPPVAERRRRNTTLAARRRS